MSRIARQLCDEIEAPLRGKNSQRYGSYEGKYVSKPERSIIIDKQKVISKVSNNRSASRIKFKSDVKSLNQLFIDVGVNTTLRGPLLSDNHCVTLVRHRANEKCNCKTPQKWQPFRKNAKEVQTNDPKLYAFSDKACLHCIDTITCGTQYSKPQANYSTNKGICEKDSRQIDMSQMDYLRQIDYLSHIGLLQKDSLTQINIKQSIFKQLEQKKMDLKQTDLGQRDNRQYEQVRNFNKPSKINYMRARRWSLSQYPSYGPDF